ncbi:MAG: Gldg family protein [Planctomycetes bacterium]|nr:Gldg family protein [Planctomycetota bacterium]
MKRFWTSIGGLLTLLVLFVAFNVVANAWLRGGRVDLTENKLYTLSPGTRNILGNLSEPITLRFYFSKKLAQRAPGVVTYAERVQQLLEEYVSLSKGKIRLEVADPEPFTEIEDAAVAHGLKGVPASAAGEMLYFGLVGTNSTDGKDLIPFFHDEREEFLEYDVTRLVDNLRDESKRVVGILTALPLNGNPMARMLNPQANTQPWYVTESLRESFEVRMIDASTTRLEPDLDVLFVVHPQALAPQTLFEIDQYVLRGGKLVAFLDPYCEAQEVRQDPQNPLQSMMADRSSRLDPLLGAWGLEMPAEDLAGDKDLALRVGWQNSAVDYVLWLGLRKDKDVFGKDDVATSELDNVHLASAGFLRKKDGATTTITPLMETTRNAMRIPKTRIQFGPDPAELLTTYASQGERLMLAARVTGPARTAYPEGRPAAQLGDGETAPNPAEQVLQESRGPIQVVVVADVDLLADRMWVQMLNFFGQTVARTSADNGAFVVNLADNLSGSSDLISLRSRGRSIRPFEKVDELRKAAETRSRQKAKDLEAALREAERKINELQGSSDASNALIITPEMKAELEKFQAERNKTRKELRAVKADLNKDIEGLKTRLVLINGLSVPFLVALAGIAVWSVRRRKMIDARLGRAGS